MQVGLIPPKGFEHFALQSTFQLALPQLVDDFFPTYRQSRNQGDYIVLDNGAAEGELVDNETLLRLAGILDADEIVAPDVMRDAAGTVAETGRFLMWYKQAIETGRYSARKVMAVVQGTHLEEFKKCAHAYAMNEIVTTIGIPRLMLGINSLGLPARIEFANWLQYEFGNRFEIHLLGANPKWVREVSAAADDAPHVRSIDTSLPFTYALASMTLQEARLPLMRVTDYFSRDWSKSANAGLVEKNIDTYMRWAGATK